ncbi:hypothetical protein FE783_31255 [Paenibacillus mesophilus]|uniref:hypothetical protein n=1 Tax=Paenibacillus mesophilus TaxID=2582849 RepID=UPI00110E99ED|nr:hypothetical protein [Paenibacillus mesophilus]TMV44815.1 hypothetical protein FE783_31255 [Paenibacillus mesophilus]
MPKVIIDIFQFLANLAAVVALIIAGLALKENINIRRTSVKPLLFPGRITEFISDDNLFSCNYEYPIIEDIGSPVLAHFGIKNIGKGPAKRVSVLSFQSEEENPVIFRVGSNAISIPEGGSIPFVIRIARKDPTDYYFITYTTTIYYEDIFGNGFYISIRLWIQESGVIVIEYNELDKPNWQEFKTVVSREVEAHGYFEMRNLEKKINKE